MQFSGEDIKRLYGARFFVIATEELETPDIQSVSPEPVVSSSEETPPESIEEVAVKSHVNEMEAPAHPPKPNYEQERLTSGTAPVWKLKPGASLALILQPEEFTNKEATGFLKQALVSASVDVSKIGFGVLENNANACQLTDMPTPTGLIFQDWDQDWPAEGFNLGEKRVYVLPSLDSIRANPEATQALHQILTKL
ncbi:MAG: hypothetical protein AAF206_03000 [Bacteroidota bacterium]